MGNACTMLEGHEWTDPTTGTNIHFQDGYRPRKKGVYQDMDAPLSHYFISSGHNSYLSGDQIRSACSTSTIVRSLMHSCRVIELDVYDGPKGPICKHGPITRPIMAQECIRAIKEYGFRESSFPIIITFENHLKPEGQKQLAKILQDTLGDKLFVPPEEPPTEWASPKHIGERVVIRTSLKDNAAAEFRRLVYIVNRKFKTLDEMNKLQTVSSSSFVETDLPECPELHDLATAASKHAPKDWSAKGAAQKSPTVSRQHRRRSESSAPPPTAAEVLRVEKEAGDKEDAHTGEPVKGSMAELYNYTSRHLMRTYPAGWRVTSNNYEPLPAWVRGASFVALNWQVWDRPMWINEGMFMDNGRCGYVKKPEWMIRPHPDGLPMRDGRTLELHLHTAHRPQGYAFCMFKDDLFITAEVLGMPSDTKRLHTKTAGNTGRLVMDQVLQFPIQFPELAVLLLQLRDEDSDITDKKLDADTIAYYCLPLNNLATGHYQVPLRHPEHPRNRTATWIKFSVKWEDAPMSPRDTPRAKPLAALSKGLVAEQQQPPPPQQQQQQQQQQQGDAAKPSPFAGASPDGPEVADEQEAVEVKPAAPPAAAAAAVSDAPAAAAAPAPTIAAAPVAAPALVVEVPEPQSPVVQRQASGAGAESDGSPVSNNPLFKGLAGASASADGRNSKPL